MTKLLIGSTNPAKVKEFSDILAGRVDQIVTPAVMNIREEPEEDGETFAENSLLKANFYWQRANIPTLTDDGGLEIDALGGAPGVHSRRWGGERMSDEALRQKVLTELSNVPEDKRTARLTIVVTLRLSKDVNFQSEASIAGVIRQSNLPLEPGYPFRAIFWLPQLNKFYSQITPEEHLQMSHRRQAIQELLPYFDQYL